MDRGRGTRGLVLAIRSRYCDLRTPVTSPAATPAAKIGGRNHFPARVIEADQLMDDRNGEAERRYRLEEREERFGDRQSTGPANRLPV